MGGVSDLGYARLDDEASYTYDMMVEDRRDFLTTMYVAFAGFTVIIWDHMITFGDEVELIWKQKKTFMAYIFLLNRYIGPLSFIVCFYAYLSPTFTYTECVHFVKYEGIMVAIAQWLTGLMMLWRLKALWRDHPLVLYFNGAIFIAWVTVTILVISQGFPVPHTPAVHTCTEMDHDIFPGTGPAALAINMFYDTVVFGFILAKTLPFQPHRNTNTIARTLATDGLLYYMVVIIVNLLWTVMLLEAPAGLQNITGQLKLLLTVAMGSRITLNLPKEHRRITGRGSRQPSRWENAPSIFPPIELTSLSQKDPDSSHGSSLPTEEMSPPGVTSRNSDRESLS